MKRISTYLIGLSIISISTVSCTKEGHDETTRQQTATPQVIQANVPAGQTYVLNLGAGTAASIKTQALHFQVSEIATAPDGSVVYKYIAAKDYAGADEITLQKTITTTTAQGVGCSRDYTNSYTSTAVNTIVIKFKVAN